VLCVKIDSNGYRAISVPPTVKLSPLLAEDFAAIRGKEEAVRESDIISQVRKDFLIERWSYWDKWALTGNRGTISVGDYE
jgi:hypothetical protein